MNEVYISEDDVTPTIVQEQEEPDVSGQQEGKIIPFDAIARDKEKVAKELTRAILARTKSW